MGRPFVDVEGPFARLAVGAADVEVQFMMARAGLESLAASDQNPLTRELDDAGERQVLHLGRAVWVLAILAEVVDEERGRPRLQASIADRLEQGPTLNRFLGSIADPDPMRHRYRGSMMTTSIPFSLMNSASPARSLGSLNWGSVKPT